jgi:hypothetical protein
VERALGPEVALSGKGLVADLDPAPGIEALVVTHRGSGGYQLALLRGDHSVLLRTPLGGKVLANAYIRHAGELRLEPGLAGGQQVILLPVETLVRRNYVCGILAFRFRSEMLALVGELASLCWRRQAGARADIDPYSLLTLDRSVDPPALTVEEGAGARRYSWDPEQGALVPRALIKQGNKGT